MPYRNADEQRAYQRRWLQARRNEGIQSKGGACAECGSTESLEVDHIDPGLKSMNPRNIWGLNSAARNAELAKCQVLCRECHKRKTSAQFTKRQHGEVGMYNQGGCRCEPCRAASAAKKRAQRAKWKQSAA